MLGIGLDAAIVATLVWIVGDVFSKSAVKKIGFYNTAMFYLIFDIVPILLVMLVLGFSVGNLNLYSVSLCIIAGFFSAGGYLLLYRILNKEQVTNSYAISEVQPAILVILGLFVLGEHVTSLEEIGIIIIFVGLFLVATTKRLRVDKKLGSAVLANISWSMLWILLIFAISASGVFLLPLLIAKVTAVVFGLLLGKYDKRIEHKHKFLEFVPLVLLLGLLDGLGNLLFSYVAYLNVVAVASAITALIPLGVGILGYLFFKEKLTKLQLVGFLIAIMGAVIIGL